MLLFFKALQLGFGGFQAGSIPHPLRRNCEVAYRELHERGIGQSVKLE